MPPAIQAASVLCTQVVLNRLGPDAPLQAPAGLAEQPALPAPSFVPPPVREPAATKLDPPVPQPEAAPVQQVAPGVQCSLCAWYTAKNILPAIYCLVCAAVFQCSGQDGFFELQSQRAEQH